MELTRRIIANGHEYQFLCETGSTRSGFSHTCHLLRDGGEVAVDTVHYINRTWESYRFRTVMCRAIESLIGEEKKYLEDEYRKEHGISRMTAKRREEFEKSIADVELLKELREVRDQL